MAIIDIVSERQYIPGFSDEVMQDRHCEVRLQASCRDLLKQTFRENDSDQVIVC